MSETEAVDQPDPACMQSALEEIVAIKGCECDSYFAHTCLVCRVRSIARGALEYRRAGSVSFAIEGADLAFLRAAIIEPESSVKWITKPIWRDGQLIFTDGRILVACDCPEIPPVEYDCWVEVEDERRRTPAAGSCPSFHRILQAWKESERIEIDRIRKMDGLSERWLVKTACGECLAALPGVAMRCKRCGGVGFYKELDQSGMRPIVVGAGNTMFATRYLWLIQQLPGNVIYAPVADSVTLSFSHAAGRGILMAIASPVS